MAVSVAVLLNWIFLLLNPGSVQIVTNCYWHWQKFNENHIFRYTQVFYQVIPRSTQSFFLPRSFKWVPEISEDLVLNGKLSPHSGSAALLHLNRIHKKGLQSFLFKSFLISPLLSKSGSKWCFLLLNDHSECFFLHDPVSFYITNFFVAVICVFLDPFKISEEVENDVCSLQNQ